MARTNFLTFRSNQIPGVIVVNAFAILSTVALLSIAVVVVHSWCSILFHRSSRLSSKMRFLNTQLGYYAASLLLANLIISVAGIMNFPFLLQAGIREGTFCTAQALLTQLGNVAIAYFTLAIAIHTMFSLVFSRRQTGISLFAIFVGWAGSAFIAVVPIISATNSKGLYGISGLSCGVSTKYGLQFLLFHLLPIFISAVASAAVYGFVFFALRGSKQTFKKVNRISLTLDDQVTKGYRTYAASIARTMLWYPIAYIVLLMPYSVTRLLSLARVVVPFQVLVFAYVCWFMLGVANAVGFFNTFRVIARSGRLKSQSDTERSKTATEKSYSGSQSPETPRLLLPKLPSETFSPLESFSYSDLGTLVMARSSVAFAGVPTSDVGTESILSTASRPGVVFADSLARWDLGNGPSSRRVVSPTSPREKTVIARDMILHPTGQNSPIFPAGTDARLGRRPSRPFLSRRGENVVLMEDRDSLVILSSPDDYYYSGPWLAKQASNESGSTQVQSSVEARPSPEHFLERGNGSDTDTTSHSAFAF